jgi:uncharacterized delta-60 repeat protein
MKKIFFSFAAIILLFETTFSQVTEEWVARYSGPGSFDDDATALAIDNSGNAYVTGYSYVSGPRHDYTTIKYNSDGDTVWVRRYNGTGNNTDLALAIAVDISGNVYVTGESVGSGPGQDYATVKYNSAGEEQWAARYNGPGNYWDTARAIEVDDSGNVYVTGESYGFGYDIATIKYNSNGDSVWVRRYHSGNGEDLARDIAVDDSGNVYVTGYSAGLGTFNDYVTIKYNSTGDSVWVRRYNGPGNGYDYAIAVTIDDSGNVYVTGNSSGSTTDDDYTTIKYNPVGEELWIARYNGLENQWDEAVAIAVDNIGNVYVTGCSYSVSTNRDFATIKYNSNGDTVWVRKYNGPANDQDYGRAIAIDNSGNVYVTGESYDSNSDDDYATIKYSTSGVQEWVMRYNGPANDKDNSVSLAVDAMGNVFVTGTSLGVGTDNDYATIKYSSTTGVETLSNDLPTNYSLSQNYPNPFNPSTNIKFTISDFGFVSLKVYDVLGNEIANLVNEEKLAGEYEVEFNTSSIKHLPSSGVYFYQLKAGDFIRTKKMILLK